MNIEALTKITYGMFVVSTCYNNKLNGYLGNTVMQVSASPNKLAIACSKNNFSAAMICNSKMFSVSVLNKSLTKDIIRMFGYQSGRDCNKFDNFTYKTSSSGCPILLDCTTAWIECKVVDIFDMGTHYLFIGEVINCNVVDNSETITYQEYHEIFKAKTPVNAPTYRGDNINNNLETKKSETMDTKKYQCDVCGYVYDPAVGDPDGGIAPGTPFENIPEDWVCPICGVDKSNFSAM